MHSKSMSEKISIKLQNRWIVILILQVFSFAHGDASRSMDPNKVDLEFSRFDKFYRVQVSGESGSLRSVVFTWISEEIEVPEDELKDVANPNLSSVELWSGRSSDKRELFFYIYMQYGNHPTLSEVRFVFVNGKYTKRNIKKYIKKNEWRWLEKLPGKPGRDLGRIRTMEGVASEKPPEGEGN